MYDQHQTDLTSVVIKFTKWFDALPADVRAELQRAFRIAAYEAAAGGDGNAVALVQVFDPKFPGVTEESSS